VCPKCGAANPDNIVYCRNCGAQLPFVGTSAPTSEPEPIFAVEPGAPTGRKLASEVLGGISDERRHPGASPTLMIGGMCAMIAGILAIAMGILFLSGLSVVSSIVGFGSWTVWGVLVGLGEIVLGVLSYAGGTYARKPHNYRMALIGAILGMLGPGFPLGLVAVILIAMCRDEFPDSKPAET